MTVRWRGRRPRMIGGHSSDSLARALRATRRAAHAPWRILEPCSPLGGRAARRCRAECAHGPLGLARARAAMVRWAAMDLALARISPVAAIFARYGRLRTARARPVGPGLVARPDSPARVGGRDAGYNPAGGAVAFSCADRNYDRHRRTRRTSGSIAPCHLIPWPCCRNGFVSDSERRANAPSWRRSTARGTGRARTGRTETPAPLRSPPRPPTVWRKPWD